MSKVTVVGAGKYGSTTVQRLAEADIADEVVMIDIVDDLPQGLALDMNQSRPVLGYRTLVTGTNDYVDTAGSDVVVITAGLPRKPGMSRMDLLEVNAKIVKQVTEQIVAQSPEAVIVVVGQRPRSAADNDDDAACEQIVRECFGKTLFALDADHFFGEMVEFAVAGDILPIRRQEFDQPEADQPTD